MPILNYFRTGPMTMSGVLLLLVIAIAALVAASTVNAQTAHAVSVSGPESAHSTLTVPLLSPNTAYGISVASGPTTTSIQDGVAPLPSYTSREADSSFECQLYSGAFSECSSPKPYTGTMDATHTFQVVLTNGKGNPEPTPASHTKPTAGDLITNVVVSNGKTYQRDTLGTGKLTYNDRDYTFTSLPVLLDGQEYIRTANNDKTATKPDFLTFRLTANATVYVLLDDRVGTLPAWLNDGIWRLTGETVDIADGTRRVYQKQFSAGIVQVGGNAMAPMSGAESNYTVVAVATETTPTAGDLVTNIRVSNGKTYQKDTISSGQLTYNDRDYSFTSVPDLLEGQEYIRTANNDKTATKLDFLTFRLTANATVYVLFDDRVARLPAWMNDGIWSLTGETVDIADATRRVYQKQFSAGIVQLGGNAMAPMNGAESNYTVVAVATESTPPETNLDGGPSRVTTDTTASFSFTSGEADSSFECQLDGEPFIECSSPKTYTALIDAAHTFQVVATDAAGDSDPTAASYTWTVDTTPPETSLDSGPGSVTTNTTASFTFTSGEADSNFECQLDGEAFSECSSPKTYTDLVDGAHTFQVAATDAAGNPDPTAASHTWTLNTAPPAGDLITDIVVSKGNTYQKDTISSGQLTYNDRDYIFTSVPDLLEGQEYIRTANNDKTATKLDFLTFRLTANATVYVLFDDRVDRLPAWLNDGIWSLTGEAVDIADATRRVYQKPFSAGIVQLGGNAMAPMNGAESNYTVVAVATESTPPETNLDGGPPSVTTDTTASFSFTSSEAGSSFECQLDGEPFSECASPKTYTGLIDAAHTFQVVATDAAGITDPTPAAHTWTVVTTQPAGDQAWDETSPALVGVDPPKLNDAMNYLASQSGPQGTNRAVVIRDGYLIWKGSEYNQQHNSWSVTKSFTGTILGLLIDDGLTTLDSSASSYVSSLSVEYASVTLRNFVTLTSGYDGGGDRSATWYNPTTPLFPPGSEFHYRDSALNQQANVLTNIAGQSIETYFKTRVADPIGMDPSEWDWGDFETIDGFVVNGGAGDQRRGIKISPQQLAKLGQLFLNRGNWKGTQILSSSWVSQATTNQVPVSTPSHVAGALGPGVYGFNWWVNGFDQTGKLLWPNGTAGTYAALGNNNNVLMIVPEWNMVIVRQGTSNDLPVKGAGTVWDVFLGMMNEAVNGSSPGTPTAVDDRP